MHRPEVHGLVQRVSLASLRAHVLKLAVGQRNSLADAERHASSLEYMRRVLGTCGLEMREHIFEYAGRTGVNLVGRKPGAVSEMAPLLVCAHYDTVTDSMGAGDNASGVSVMLESARILASVPLARTVEFVAFAMEEAQPEGDALVGSSAFVRDTAQAVAYNGVFNLESVGFTSGPGTQDLPPGFQLLFPEVYHHVESREFTGDSIVVVAMGEGVSLGRALVTSTAEHVPALDVVSIELGADLPALADAFRSDHAPFWAAGIPAVMLTDTANFRNPHYHSPSDTPETLDYDFLATVTHALVATVAEQASS